MPEHAQRLNKIRSNYQAEFKKFNIRNIADVVSFLENIYYNKSEINFHDLLIKYKEHSAALQSQLSRNNRNYTFEINNYPKTLFFKNIENFFIESDDFFKKNNEKTGSIVSSNEICEISINDSEINDDEIPLLRKK